MRCVWITRSGKEVCLQVSAKFVRSNSWPDNNTVWPQLRIKYSLFSGVWYTETHKWESTILISILLTGNNLYEWMSEYSLTFHPTQYLLGHFWRLTSVAVFTGSGASAVRRDLQSQQSYSLNHWPSWYSSFTLTCATLRLRNYLYYVGWGVKLYSLAHSRVLLEPVV